MDDLEFPK